MEVVEIMIANKLNKITTIVLMFGGVAYGDAAFEIRPETIVIPIVSYHDNNEAQNYVERTIFGRFYLGGDEPVLLGMANTKDFSFSPYTVLSEMLELLKEQKFDDLPKLYSPQTRNHVYQRLADENIRPRLLEWLRSIREIRVMGVWLEAPNRLIAYVRKNDEETGSHPYVFEYINGKWFLRAGHFESDLSNYLDAFYMKYNNSSMQIISPPELEAMLSLSKNKDITALAESLGLRLE